MFSRFRIHTTGSLPHTDFVLLALVLLAMACASEQSEDVPSDQPARAPAAQPAVDMDAPPGPVDPQMADSGETLFQTKGCAGCHTIGGGRLTGPDLRGVTERRKYDWIVAMITRPDSMLKADLVAKSLFAEYMTPMLPVPVTDDEAAALYEFLRREGG